MKVIYLLTSILFSYLFLSFPREAHAIFISGCQLRPDNITINTGDTLTVSMSSGPVSAIISPGLPPLGYKFFVIIKGPNDFERNVGTITTTTKEVVSGLSGANQIELDSSVMRLPININNANSPTEGNYSIKVDGEDTDWGCLDGATGIKLAAGGDGGNGEDGDGNDGGTATGRAGEPTPCTTNDGKEGIETALGCIPTDVSGFVETLLSIFLGVAGGIAFLMMIFGTFKIIGSSGDPDALQEGRSIITAAITGLLLILFSVFILNLIGIKILQLPIPGIGFIPQSSVAYAQFAGVPDPTKYGGKDLGQVVSDLLPFVFSLAAIVTFLYLLYGGFKYLTASGDPKAVDSARKVITSAITGLIIIFLAFTIITVLGRVLGLPFVFISPIYAQGVNIGEAFGIPSDLRELGGFGSFISQKVLPLVFGLTGIIFFFYLLFGGIKYLTAGGDPKAVDSAKRSLTTAFIGLLIIFLSFWIMVVIGNIVGFKVF